VKNGIESVHIYGSYCKIKTGITFWTTLYSTKHIGMFIVSVR